MGSGLTGDKNSQNQTHQGPNDYSYTQDYHNRSPSKNRGSDKKPTNSYQELSHKRYELGGGNQAPAREVTAMEYGHPGHGESAHQSSAEVRKSLVSDERQTFTPVFDEQPSTGCS